MMHIERSQSRDRILNFIVEADHDFIPPVGSRVDLVEYATKLSIKAVNLFAVDNCNDIGHAAFYSNDSTTKNGFISSFAVKRDFRGTESGVILLKHVIQHCRNDGMNAVLLEVDKRNIRAIEFYKKNGFYFHGNLMYLDIV